jgi:hypothetical protein
MVDGIGYFDSGLHGQGRVGSDKFRPGLHRNGPRLFEQPDPGPHYMMTDRLGRREYRYDVDLGRDVFEHSQLFSRLLGQLKQHIHIRIGAAPDNDGNFNIVCQIGYLNRSPKGQRFMCRKQTGILLIITDRPSFLPLLSGN